MAGQTLSLMDANRTSSTFSNPSNSQSLISFAVLFERAIVDMSSSSLRASEPFGCSIARRKCQKIGFLGYFWRQHVIGGDVQWCRDGTFTTSGMRCDYKIILKIAMKSKRLKNENDL